jgi:hypothetical protein
MLASGTLAEHEWRERRTVFIPANHNFPRMPYGLSRKILELRQFNFTKSENTFIQNKVLACVAEKHRGKQNLRKLFGSWPTDNEKVSRRYLCPWVCVLSPSLNHCGEFARAF